ncbi:MAG: hypothetical protein NC517_01405 [Firmicutes bacterium]|nr:hypothetical protein [Bacillota bacterium]
MSAYLRTFTCSRCGRKFVKMVGGIVPTDREIMLSSRPICDSCKADQAVEAGVKGITFLKKMVQRKRRNGG